MVAVIAGPTASGKSAMALTLAERIGGTIINADASQLYADLRVLTARPDADDAARVPHRLYGVLDGNDVANAARWADMARSAIVVEIAAGRVPILVGGTGLYLTTLIDGIAPVPAIDPAVRETVRAMTTAEAGAALAAEDGALRARLMAGDRQRLLRGLEVVRATGRSLLDWQRERVGGIGDVFDVRAMIVENDREVLRARIEPRLRAMIDAGALGEAAALMARGLPADRPILRALGVAELAAVLAGGVTLDAAVATAGIKTRQYQKRQMTWARSQAAVWQRVRDAADAAAMLRS